MEKGGFTLIVVLLAYVHSAHSGSETVWLEDVTTRFQTDKRTLGDLDLPDQLTFHLRRGAEALTLNLERNYDINPNTDMYFVRKVKDGQFHLMKTRNLDEEDVAYYQDRENGASMTVRCVKRSSEACDRVINGNIRIGDTSYDLRPMEEDATPGNVLEVTGLLGKRYFLQDILSIRRENSAENKEAENVEEEIIARHRRLHGQSAVFSSRNIAVLNNRGETSDSKYSDRDDREVTTRQLKRNYYIDVAVLIDSSIWDLYSSRVRITDVTKKRDKVKKNIRETYSHIMNGVNLLYKGIEDTSISIKITLCAFIFFQRVGLFSHKLSEVIKVNGSTYIEAYAYLGDLSDWDKTPASNARPLFDHAMLFTRHNMYQGVIAKHSVGGVSFDGGVCVPGDRTSVIQTNDYVRIVTAAAHELGHNIGAFHDGEKEAQACNPRDLFIMTPKVRPNKPGMSYTKYRWRFSNCSVESFKNTLKQKQCVINEGQVYNAQEWMGYVMHQLGEVYSPDDQCYFINGPNSVHCGTVSEDICHLMRCTYPNRKECMPKYFYAATGTKCGHEMWCFEGKCNPKG